MPEEIAAIIERYSDGKWSDPITEHRDLLTLINFISRRIEMPTIPCSHGQADGRDDRRRNPRSNQMRWIADQADFIKRLSTLPWAGDEANLYNIEVELRDTLRVVEAERVRIGWASGAAGNGEDT